MFQLGGDDVLTDMPCGLCNALDSKVVGLACAGGVDDLGRLHAKVLRNRARHTVHLSTGLLPGDMSGVGVGNVAPLRRDKGVQNGRVCRGVGGIIKVDHGVCPLLQ